MKSIELFLIALIACFPLSALAHGDSPSFETETGGYLIDIGYDREGIRPQEEVTFDFDLLTAGDRPAFIPFQTIVIDIMKGSGIVMQQVLVNDPEFVPTLAVTFDEAGEYEMTVAYTQSGQAIASSSFDLHIEPSAGLAAGAENTLRYVVATLLVGFAAAAIFMSYLRFRA